MRYSRFILSIVLRIKKYCIDINPNSVQKKIQKANVAKIMVNVQKRLKWASVRADFFHGENLDHPEKKAQNSDFY